MNFKDDVKDDSKAKEEHLIRWEIMEEGKPPKYKETIDNQRYITSIL
jgi:hypothetical protein